MRGIAQPLSPMKLHTSRRKLSRTICKTKSQRPGFVCTLAYSFSQGESLLPMLYRGFSGKSFPRRGRVLIWWQPSGSKELKGWFESGWTERYLSTGWSAARFPPTKNAYGNIPKFIYTWMYTWTCRSLQTFFATKTHHSLPNISTTSCTKATKSK